MQEINCDMCIKNLTGAQRTCCTCVNRHLTNSFKTGSHGVGPSFNRNDELRVVGVVDRNQISPHRKRVDSENTRDSRLYQGLNSLALSDSDTDSSTDKETITTGPKHLGITCDACRAAVVGIRWSCCLCMKYDLCGHCYKKGKHHTRGHDFYRIKKPGGIRVRTTSSNKVETLHVCINDLELTDTTDEEYQSAEENLKDHYST